MTLLNVLDRISFNTPVEFIAPIPNRDNTRVLSIQNNIPYWFKVRVDNPGWYLLVPRDSQHAEIIKEAASYERLEYLKELPRFYVIALFPINDNTWMVSPFNLSDAEQRGWHNGTPMPMYFSHADEIRCLEIIEARKMNNHFLHYGRAYLTNMFSPIAIDHARNIVYAHAEILKKQEGERARQEKLSTFEGRIETSLEFSGANLEKWKEITPNNFEIEWEIDGKEYKMRVDQNLRVLSAGVCLAGTDNFHSLSSVVSVMQDRQHAINIGEHGDY